MMRILILFFIISISIPVFADELFIDSESKELRVTEVNVEEGSSWIQDADGNEIEVYIGDKIGIERGVIVEINRASITIQIDNTRIKMPVIYGFE